MEELQKSFFFSFGNSFNETTSILEGRILKVSHSTRTANLQLVDPACAAAQEHVETRIWNFIFCQYFCQIAARAHFGSCNRWRNYRNLFSFRLAILLMKLRVFSRVE